jgi:hypothetical protein
MAIHAIGESPLRQIPYLNKVKATLISLLVETETICVPSG